MFCFNLLLYCSKEILTYLIQHPDVKINARNWEGMTPLFLSLLQKADDEMIEVLINNNCDVNIPNNENVTPLHLAVQRSTTTISDLLIRRGANIEATDFDGYTPILDAIKLNSIDNIYMLLYYNADVNIGLTDANVTAIEMAVVMLDDATLLEILGDYVAEYDKITHTEETLLFTALSLQKAIALKLLDNGADPYFVANSISCLGLIASKWDARLFLNVWSKLDLYKLLNTHPRFLIEYLSYSNFNKTDFMRCLYVMLTSSIGENLVNCDSMSLCLLFYSLNKYQIEKQERLEMLYLLLSIGLVVSHLDLLDTYHMYGFNEELEIFMKLDTHLDNIIIPLEITNYSTIFSLILNIRSYYKVKLLRDVPIYIQEYAFSRLINIAKYFNIKSYLTPFEHVEEIANITKNLSNVLSLKEIARNRFRQQLASYYHVSKPFEYYSVLRKLNIPQTYKDIILLKKPIYLL